MRVLYIGNRLSKHGFTPTAIEYLGPLLQNAGLKVNFASDKRWILPRLFDMVYSVLMSKPGDIVLIDTYSSLAFYYSLICGAVASMKGVPYVVILHGGNFMERTIKSAGLVRYLFRHAARVVSVSVYLQKSLVGTYSTLYIPNSVEIAQYRFRDLKTVDARLLWVRSLHTIYNPELALQIVAILRSDYPNLKLAMVGPDKDGSLERLVEKTRLEGIEQHVIFTGKLEKEEWVRKSVDYDIFINTTNIDNMPVSVIEAMALGLPVVSTNVGGVPYLIEDEKDGLLVGPGDANAFATAIRRLIRDPELVTRLTQAARKKAETFDAPFVAKQWSDLIYEISRSHS